MQPGSKKLVHFMQSWIINTVAVLMAVFILRNHISYADRQLPGWNSLKTCWSFRYCWEF